MKSFFLYSTRVKKIIERAHERHRDYMQKYLVDDPKSFWYYIRSKRGSRNPQEILKEEIVLTGEQCRQRIS